MSVFKLNKENRNYVVWEIYDTIKLLSNKKVLFKVWLEGSIPDIVSSYTDLFCVFFDDLNFEYFVSNDSNQLRFNFELKRELELLITYYRAYNKQEYHDKWMDDKILEDEEFDKVIAQANKVVELWKKDEEAKKYIKLE